MNTKLKLGLFLSCAYVSFSLYIHKLTPSFPKVESQLKTHQLVDNICVYADSQKTHTVALLVPIRDQLEKFAAKEINSDFQSMSFEQLCEDDNLEKVKYRVYKLKYISKYFFSIFNLNLFICKFSS